MERFDIINRLIASRFPTGCNYLEIGVRNPADCFDKIKATKKTSVDPGLEYKLNPVDYKMTSDEFFKAIEEGKTEFKDNHVWDVIFIDGLHLAPQIHRDVMNALFHTHETSYIVMHDCNPPNWYNAHSDIEFFSTNGGYWNGTAWKVLYDIRTYLSYDIYTVDTDWGVGVIDKATSGNMIEHDNLYYEYGVMMKNRKEYLGLITVDEFLNKVVV